MAFVRPVAGFEQYGAEDARLDDLSSNAVDLHPVAHANSVLTHQDKPAEEGKNKSCKTTVIPAVVRPMMVGIWLGAPKITRRMIVRRQAV